MDTVQTKNRVLGEEDIARRMKRMALEVAERNIEEEELVVMAINGNGEVVADCLVSELRKFSSLRIEALVIRLNKKDPGEVAFDREINLENKVVVVVDDVANTGKTLLYSLKPLLQTRPKKIQTLVLVERSHKLFPIQTDYVGLSIATTLQEHIAVETEGKRITNAVLY
jgi:pyrimidine operon attenuation protein/uracil phosphoribosyltransferase